MKVKFENKLYYLKKQNTEFNRRTINGIFFLDSKFLNSLSGTEITEICPVLKLVFRPEL